MILWRAGSACYVNVVQILVSRNDTDVNVLDNTRKRPLSLAARNGHKEVVQPLLGHTE